jgi:deoxyribodipyrimidine photo-lyase
MTMNSVNINRIRALNPGISLPGPVIYWMQRDQRVNGNWALLFAQETALEMKQPLVVVFCLVRTFLEAKERHYQFMLSGLVEVECNLKEKNILFVLLEGEPEVQLPEFLDKVNASCLITDFNPLRLTSSWRASVSRKIKIPFYEVDAHNVVPCRTASDKQEFSARTLRLKLQKLLPDYLKPYPLLIKHPFLWENPSEKIYSSNSSHLNHQSSFISEIKGFRSGENEANSRMKRFVRNQLSDYHLQRNFPEKEGQSGLSPYLHFGQISAQSIALEIQTQDNPVESKNAFLEELIVRKELSDNYCYYNPDYDRFEGFPAWAKKTLNVHRDDFRLYSYSLEAFENAQTHDDLWNAAQKELLITGKMHGYMRMYWAKKILEWTGSPEEAMTIAVYLNDKYAIDGRDPNGYAGIAWSIGGVHDRPWGGRPVFGNVRYMNYNGCLRKFDVKAYIRKISLLSV